MAQKAFDLPEILEAILLEIDDYEDLLISRNVCTQWRLTWNASIRIQRRLFLAPAQAGDEWVQGRKISPKDVQRIFDGVDLGDEKLHESICKNGITLNPHITFGLQKNDTIFVDHLWFYRDTLVEMQMYITQPPLRMETWQVLLPESQWYYASLKYQDTSGLKLGELSDKMHSHLDMERREAMISWECTFVDVNGRHILDEGEESE